MALMGIEAELRLMVPPVVRRQWPADWLEDAIGDFLHKLLRTPPSASVDNYAAYVRRSFRNHCIDVHKARSRRKESPLVELDIDAGTSAVEAQTPANLLNHRERALKLHEAIAQLEIADRIALKLEHAPEWLTESEVAWLSKQCGLDITGTRAAIQRAGGDVHALTRIFDPSNDDPSDADARRDRMERFRKRRSRARCRLLDLLRDIV